MDVNAFKRSRFNQHVDLFKTTKLSKLLLPFHKWYSVLLMGTQCAYWIINNILCHLFLTATFLSATLQIVNTRLLLQLCLNINIECCLVPFDHKQHIQVIEFRFATWAAIYLLVSHLNVDIVFFKSILYCSLISKSLNSITPSQNTVE